jgi:hypothetical protein
MEGAEQMTTVQMSNAYRWILSSGVVAAGVAIWGTLLGLLYRTGWLSVFGVSQDLFIPNSATELTYWGYIALLEGWVALQKGLYEGLLKVTAVVVFAGVVGLLLGFLSMKHKSRFTKLLEGRLPRLSLSLSVFLGTLVLYPVVVFVAATALLLLPFPAYSVGKKSAERAIEQYRTELSSGRRNCHVLMGPNGQIGTCPMVIAQTMNRVAFLDGSRVYITPNEGIHWALPPAGQLLQPQR